MAGKAKAVSEEYKSALVDLTFNSKPMINLLTMLAEENNEYAQSIVNVICDRIKQVVNEQKMPALYLLDSILKNIGKEYMAIISKNIVDVFCCVFETAPDERKRMQLFKLRNTWNQYIPSKVLYELDVRITRTDPNWPVAAPVVTTAPVTVSSKQVIHVNPKFLKTSDPSTATTISATLAASIVAEKEASKLQNKINKQRLLEEEKRVQEQLRILQADKLKRDREQHELVLRRQKLEKEQLIAEQKRQLEVLRKQQQTMTDSVGSGIGIKQDDVKMASSKSSEGKVKDSKPTTSKSADTNTKSSEQAVNIISESKTRNIESSVTTKVIPNIPPPTSGQGLVKDPRLKSDALPNDPRVNRNKSKTNKSAVNVMNKIVTNLSTKKTQPEDIPQMPSVRKIRPYVNPLYARSPVCIATASQSFASSSYSTLNLSVPKENTPPPVLIESSTCVNDPLPPTIPVQSSNTFPVLSQTQTNTTYVTGDPTRNYNLQQELPVCTVTQSHSSSIMQASVSSCVTTCNPISVPPHSIPASISSVSSRSSVSLVLSSSDASSQCRSMGVTVPSTSSSVIKLENKDVSGVDNTLPISTNVSVTSHKSLVSNANLKSSISPLPVISKITVDSTENKTKSIASITENVTKPPEVKVKVEVKLEDDDACIQPSIPEPTPIATKANASSISVLHPSQPSSTVAETIKTADTVTVPISSVAATPSSAGLPPPFSGAFKNLSSRDMQIAAQAAAIATAMHQMQSGAGGIAPEQSAQLAAQLIEIMHGAAMVASTSTASTAGTVKTVAISSDASTVVTNSAHAEYKKKVPKENPKVKEINQIIHMERSARSGTSVLPKSSEKDEHKIRERSPHDTEREAKHSKQQHEREGEKTKSPERSLRSKTRERDKTQVILGDEPPSKKSKDSSELVERGRKARARSPSRYYNRMERKIESEKRVEEKGKELVLERIRKVSEGDTSDQSKLDKETVNSGKERKSPITVAKKVDEGKEAETNHKEFISLKERLYNLHKKKEQTGTIDQDILTKIMAEVDHKAKDGVLLKDHTDELMWEIRHIRAESKHLSQKPAVAQKGKNDFIEQDSISPNEHLHWRSRKDLASDLNESPERLDGSGGPHKPFEHVRPDFPNRPRFPPPFVNEPMQRHRFDGPPGMRGPPHSIRDGPGHPHFRERPPQPRMIGNAPPQLIDGTQPQFNSDGQHASMNVDGPYPPHNMDGPRPPHGPRPQHMMDGPRPPHMIDGQRPHHMMDGQRPHHMMDGLRPPHMMDGPRPPHMMDGPRPPHMMDGPRPPHMMDGPRPPHMMDGPRPPHMMDGPRPLHGMDGPRPPHGMDGPRPPHMMDGPRPLHMMDGPRPPQLMDVPRPHMEGGPRSRFMDGPRPPGMVDGPGFTHRMEVPPRQHMDGPQIQHRMDGPRHPSNMVDGLRPPHMTDGNQAAWNGLYHAHADVSRQPQMDSVHPPFSMEGPGPQPLPPTMDGSQPPRLMNISQAQNMDTTNTYPISDRSHSQHPHIQNWGHPSLLQGHSFQNTHSQAWASNLADSIYSMMNPSSTGNTSAQPAFDVSSLLGQLTAAGLLPKSSDKKLLEMDASSQQPKEKPIPEIRLVLEDLRVRCEGIVDSLFKGMQCSSCGERFPSESLNQYRDHLDWHFRQNRREKDGVRKGCRAWYFNLNDWVEQTTLKIPEVAKVQSVPEPETKEEETEEVAPHVDEAPKLVEDNSIPVGETAGDVCNVCMDPLEQYWDEDSEEWRYRKAVRENNKTYHYHCFVDYVPFELEDDSSTPPETPSFPQSPSLASMDDTEDSVIKSEEIEIDVSIEFNTSNELELNVSTEMNTNSGDVNTSTINESNSPVTFRQSRLTISMMEVIKSEDDTELTDVDNKENISVVCENANGSGPKIENPAVGARTENDVMSTLQDILRVASTAFNVSKNSNMEDKETLDIGKSSNEEMQQEVKHLLSEIIDSVVNTVSQEEVNCEAVYLLPGANVSNIAVDDIHVKPESSDNIETEVITAEIGSWDMHHQSKRSASSSDVDCRTLDESTECDKKELDDEADLAYSPYIENVDSPVYPVITTSNLACIDEESVQESNVADYPLSVVSVDATLDNDVADTMDYLLSQVTLDSEAVSLNTQNLKLFTDGLSLVTMEPCVRGVGSNLNTSVYGVSNNNGADG